MIFNIHYHTSSDIWYFSQEGNCVRYSLFSTLFFITKILIADQICSGDVFVASSPLDRPRHSSVEINIFSTGMNTWFLTINHRSITNLIHDSPPPMSKDIFLLLSRLSREEDPSLRRRARPRSLKENMSKEFTKKAQLNFTTV